MYCEQLNACIRLYIFSDRIHVDPDLLPLIIIANGNIPDSLGPRSRIWFLHARPLHTGQTLQYGPTSNLACFINLFIRHIYPSRISVKSDEFATYFIEFTQILSHFYGDFYNKNRQGKVHRKQKLWIKFILPSHFSSSTSQNRYGLSVHWNTRLCMYGS